MVKSLRFLLFALLAFWGYSSQAQQVFINEIHYDNTGTDAGEAIEIAGPAGTDLTGWSIVLYNGNGGAVYNTRTLSGTIPDSGNGFGFVNETYPSNGIQNGAPDGIALVDNLGTVVQFLSYEGTFTAVDGPAIGLLSTDIGVAELGSDPLGLSLQLSGTGTVYTDFSWQAPVSNTFGVINTGQTFTAEPVVFVNEFHYDNAGTDTGEGIELAGNSGTDLSGWTLVLYNGNGGAPYSTINLSGRFSNQDNGFGTLFFAANGLQNGSPDGFALVNAANEVIQFLSYEGSFVAVGGPADGLTSEDVGVSQPGTAPVGTSLQLQGSGTNYADFTWSETIPNTYNQINSGQSFGGIVVNPDPVLIPIAEARTKPQGSTVLVKGILTVSDQLGGPAYIQDDTGGIPVFDPAIHGTGLFQIGDEIKFVATVGAFQQQVQLGNVSEVELISQGNIVNPLMTTIDQISSALEGQLIEIPAASFVIAKGLLFPESNYVINDGSGNLQLRIDGQVSSLVGREIPTEPQIIRGVLGSFQGTLQLFPRFIEDLPGTSPFEPEGSNIPAEETLDVMTWNMEFFGATITNFGPSDVTLQAANALKVFQATLPDVIAVQEVSDNALLASVVAQLPGYAVICSDRFSRSFEAPDPTFPPQKLCLIYNTAVVEILDTKVLFEQLYDEARMGMNDLLDGYPTGTPSSFWSSGRLPWLVTAIADINGVKEKINFINIHGKSGSTNEDLLRKRFDNQALKDTLDAFYSEQNIVLLGDYNDDLDESIGGGATTYEVITSDPDFDGVTISLSEAGLRSFIFNDNVIDHITLSNELYDNYLEGSETLYIPFNFIENYANTTSDHLPVSVRLLAGEPILSDAGDGAVVYLGYEPLESTTLRAADATGGTGAYTYSWSDGQVGQEIEVSPTQTTTYILTVTDEAGNTFTDEVTVCVVDVRGDRKGKKVIVCLPVGNRGKKVTLNVATQAVPSLLRLGATLGACGVNPCEGSVGVPAEEIDFSSAKIRKIFPNPFEDQVTVELNQQLNAEVSYVLFNHRGETISTGVSSFVNGMLTLQFTDTKLRKGIYYLHLTQGQERKIIRLFKRY
ncbi:T9SS type A sorting domain-containing protein [Algoriphagus litoralis]|uniref:T9SS type A sorting domain-containing protein n=1 Tax=Algoriphagus litoralis TaxID=2202829 RepID=UPI000DBA379C|nr:T9SS type A sorting domain-containing protein [Algoriphagus litoralis]